MYLTKWHPFETLGTLQEEIDRAFRRQYKSESSNQGLSMQTAWLPAVDIHEDQESYLFDIEVPGIEKAGIDLKVEDNVLTIKGERKKATEDKGKNYHRVEREYGAFTRSFALPETADPSRTNAEYKDGVLHIKISKKEAAKPKRIDIKVA